MNVATAKSPHVRIVSDRVSNEIDDLTLARAQRGERAAAALLVRCYERRITALIGRLLVGRPDALEDAVQDAFVRILGNVTRFDRAGAARFSTWALTIATRTTLDRLRRLRTERRALGASDDDPDALDCLQSSPERTAGDRALGRRVAAAMAGLADDQRAVLVLRAYHDLDYDEIAIALNIETGTVKSRLNRAREALRSALEGPCSRALSEDLR